MFSYIVVYQGGGGGGVCHAIIIKINSKINTEFS